MPRCHTCQSDFSDASRISHCTACCRTFTSHTVADLHRVGDYTRGERRCRNDAELEALGAVKRERGWGGPATDHWGDAGAEEPDDADVAAPAR